jgi:hypothetical protein
MASIADIREDDEPPLCPKGDGYGMYQGNGIYLCAKCGARFVESSRNERIEQ